MGQPQSAHLHPPRVTRERVHSNACAASARSIRSRGDVEQRIVQPPHRQREAVDRRSGEVAEGSICGQTGSLVLSHIEDTQVESLPRQVCDLRVPGQRCAHAGERSVQVTPSKPRPAHAAGIGFPNGEGSALQVAGQWCQRSHLRTMTQRAASRPPSALIRSPARVRPRWGGASAQSVCGRNTPLRRPRTRRVPSANGRGEDPSRRQRPDVP